MADVVVLALLLTGMYYALRHVVRNFRNGREDCCGDCTACHSTHNCSFPRS
jgi:hypothetical protein